MRRARFLLIPLLAVVLLAGCDLVSGTLRLTYDVIEPGSNEHHATDQNVGTIGVDLTTDSDWKEHQDEINSVDEVGFVFRARNNQAQTATGQIYMTANPLTNPTLQQIQSQGVLVLDGFSMPAGQTVNVDFQQSLSYLVPANKQLLLDTCETGKIYLYGVASGAPFDITISQLTAVVIVTVTL